MLRHIPFSRIFCAYAFFTAVVVPPAYADLTVPRVRPVGVRMVSLLARGYVSSDTLASLVDALERSDVIVHIEEQVRRDGPAGRTQFVVAAGSQRYVRIYLDARLPDDLAVAILGHELQHASEIAGTRWVVDQETLVMLYARIGYETDVGPHVRGVDTTRARDMGGQVLRELRASVLSDSTD